MTRIWTLFLLLVAISSSGVAAAPTAEMKGEESCGWDGAGEGGGGDH